MATKTPCTVCGLPSIARGLCPTCYQRARRRGNGDATPHTVEGLDVTRSIRASAELHEAMAARAARDGVTVAEAWREAARVWLGWSEVVEGK